MTESEAIAYRQGWIYGVERMRERAACVVEQMERDNYNSVGNPMIRTFVPHMANAIRKMEITP